MPSTNPKQKILRILRVRLTDKPGFLGKIATQLGELGANIGEITIVAQGPDFVIREISLQFDDEIHLNHVINSINGLDGVKLECISDPVETIHKGGKISMKSRVALDNLSELHKIYTPGVAQICKLIQQDISLSRHYTSIANSVAVITNGTAVLGLGNIGAIAGMPVMEGKAVLFEQLVGISAIPILINSEDPLQVIETVKHIAPTFGAIQLEDIAAPQCFAIEEQLQMSLSIPVLHDDQHGTAVVVLGVLLTITQRMGISLISSSIGILGLGAAGIGIAKLLRAFGANKIIGTDIRSEAQQRLKQLGGHSTDLVTAMQQADIIIATTGVPQLIKPEMVRKGQVILALSNPVPEINPEVALANGAVYAADGRSINNALAFPGLFKGALTANAPRFTNAMKIAAAQVIAGQTKLDSLAPGILDRELHQHVADAVTLAHLSEK